MKNFFKNPMGIVFITLLLISGFLGGCRENTAPSGYYEVPKPENDIPCITISDIVLGQHTTVGTAVVYPTTEGLVIKVDPLTVEVREIHLNISKTLEWVPPGQSNFNYVVAAAQLPLDLLISWEELGGRDLQADYFVQLHFKCAGGTAYAGTIHTGHNWSRVIKVCN